MGLILTHTIITMYTAILCLIYLIWQSKALKKKEVRSKIIVSVVFIILLTAFFWIPLLEHKLGAEYEVFQQGRMERTEVLIAFKLNFIDLFFTTSKVGMIYEIGLISIILLVLTPIVIQKLKEKCKHTDFYRFYLFALTAGMACLIMTLKVFPFEHLPAILKMIQFSFRLLEFSSFFLAFVAAVNFSVLVKKVKSKDICILLVLLILTSSLFIFHLPYTENLNEERLWPAVRVTENTGRVHAGCASFEYLPSKAFQNRSYIETREDRIYVLEGNAQIKMQNKENTNLKSIVSAEGEAKLELPYIYYLGYEVTLEEQGKKETLKPYQTENGFVGVTIENVEEGILEVHYTGTSLMKFSAMISILGVVGLVGMYGVNLKKRKHNIALTKKQK